MPRSITALRLAVLRLDLVQGRAQRRLVGSVAGQHLIGQRKAVRGHHQGDDHLHAVAPLVAAVAVPALVGVILRRRRLEVGAGQVVQQNFELGPEQILPALPKMTEQRRLVRQQLVQAAVERVLADQRIVRTEQIPHGARLEPLPVQPPLAARIEQPIAHQRLQHVPPAGAFARVRQARRPELIQAKLFIQLAGQPARPPLPRPMQLHRLQPHLHAVRLGVLGHRPFGRE
jgi:hypothetical protein